MIDVLVNESFKALRNIRDAEANLSDKNYAMSQLISASHHLNTLMQFDEHYKLYKILREEYVKVSDMYLKLYVGDKRG
jgi:hypothetical protein